MTAELRVCANCRVLVEPSGQAWNHVPAFAEKFERSVCDQPAPGREPSGSEARFGLARVKSQSKDKYAIKGQIAELAGTEGGPVVVAVDGSYKLTVEEKVSKPMSWAYLADNGMWGLGTSIVPGSIIGGDVRPDGSDRVRTLQAELRAIANAVQAIGLTQPILILADSKDALGFLTLWRDGHDVMPGGYNLERAGGHESTLGRLARAIRDSAGRIQWEWVRGHSGHALNEGADVLAKTARAWATGKMERAQVEVAAPAVVQHALSQHAAACPA